jgi:hypothetical protein
MRLFGKILILSRMSNEDFEIFFLPSKIAAFNALGRYAKSVLTMAADLLRVIISTNGWDKQFKKIHIRI